MLSIFDIFKIGIGPSSSHTVGPMWAGHRFLNELKEKGILGSIASVRVGLYGSLALTGVGHGTDKASLLGLAGYQPDTIDPDEADKAFEAIKTSKKIKLAGEHEIAFDYDTQLIFHNGETLPEHPNAMRIFAADENGIVVYYKTYLSIGGGFIVCADEFNKPAASTNDEQTDDSKESSIPYPFRNAAELIKLCKANNLSIAELVIENEKARNNGDINIVNEKIDAIWDVMRNCIERGLRMEGKLPMSGIKRRSFDLHNTLTANPEVMLNDHFAIMDWVTLFAMSVNEENACGGRVVTAPTNGAAGVIPAVIAYYSRFISRNNQAGIREFLATAAAIGAIIKMNATISGAEAGCQAEVGSACSMAAGALVAVQGGTIDQVENAAEIGMEHHLGMTCDPIAGLVQIPCIERNGMAAIKAITAARLAMRGDGNHAVSLDSCVETMYRTGLDLQAKYRETSQGGLAIYAKEHSSRIA
ncbi:serine dehydratase [Endozoicomonas montiporae]|uniref:L-serine dehydratase n=2 Tax=Endozoicomonas montiporae TaxID=1027273 RepID=A0A081NAU6_9GAMM|nr:L-serine ammonia-lyase [Endozoicomonas montiporae]AMO56734.1 L-serine dehydratase [Endozoicomonas montiporae CL-33]KEQ15569.1 serine dehydratase [Endozoicomonas montiporae]